MQFKKLFLNKLDWESIRLCRHFYNNETTLRVEHKNVELSEFCFFLIIAIGGGGGARSHQEGKFRPLLFSHIAGPLKGHNQPVDLLLLYWDMAKNVHNLCVILFRFW